MNQKSLQTLLAQATQAGVYQLPQHTRTALEEAARALGFASLTVNAAESDSIDAMLSALGRDLDFPDWYGVNFDALNDCLTDFSWREAPGYLITITGADSLHGSDAGNFTTLNEVFASASETWREQDVPFWVVYEFATPTRSNGLATLPTPA